MEKLILKETGKDSLIFQRQGTSFYLFSHNNYPASIKKINDLLFDISNIQIQEKVSSSESSQKNYKVSPEDYTYSVQGFDENDKPVLSFLVGNKFKSSGNYIRQSDKKDIYLSKSPVFFSSEKDSYIDKKIFELGSKKVLKVEVSTTTRFTIEKENDKWRLKGIKYEVDDTQLSTFINTLTGLEFLSFTPVADKTLDWKHSLSFQTDDTIVYEVKFTQEGDKYYALISSSTEETPQQVSISRDDDKEKLKKVEEVLKAQKNSQMFNVTHASWVYEIRESVYKELMKGPSDFKKK